MSQFYPPAKPSVPEYMPDETQHRRHIARVLNKVLAGATNNSLQVTLAPNATSTTVSDPRISLSTSPLLTPLTADAAAVTGLYVVPAAGACVINHPSSASTDRTFAMALIG